MSAARKTKGIKFSKEEEAIIQDLADKSGMNFSEYVRRAALGEINIANDRIEKLFKEIRDELRKINKK